MANDNNGEKLIYDSSSKTIKVNEEYKGVLKEINEKDIKAVLKGISGLVSIYFGGCENLESVTFPKEVKCRILDECFFVLGGSSKLKIVIIPGCISVGDSAFQGCKHLTAANLGNFKKVGAHAFAGCKALTTVLGSKNFTEAGIQAFFGCESLNKINTSNFTEVKPGCFENCDSLTKVDLKKCNIVGYGAFRGCKNLRQIDLSACTKIEHEAFKDCPKLTFEKEESLSECKYIEKEAFKGCTELSGDVKLNKGAKCDKTAFLNTKVTVTYVS